MPPRKQQQQPSMAPISIPIGLAAAAGAAWWGFPAGAVVWLALLVTAWMEPPPLLTGKKDRSGFPTPASPKEAKQMRLFRFWGALKWRLAMPSADWLPGRGPLVIWFFGLFFGLAALHLPVNMAWMRPLNMVAMWLAVWTVAAARRATMVDDDRCPGTPVTSIKKLLGERSGQIALGAGTAAAVVIGVFLSGWATAAGMQVAPKAPAKVRLAPGDLPVPASTALLVVSVAVCAWLVIVGPVWSKIVLEHWRLVLAARDEWKPRWEALKQDPPPFLTDRQDVGTAQMDTFEASASAGAMTYWPMAPKITPTIGAGGRIAVIDTPNEDANGPISGTRHPNRFEVIVWPAEMPDIADPETPQDVVELAVRCGVAWAADAMSKPRPVLTNLERLTTDGSQRHAWESSWAWPDGPGLQAAKENGQLSSGAFAGADVLVDHRFNDGQGLVFFGDLLGENTEYEDNSVRPHLEELAKEARWNRIWAEVLKQGASPPTPQFRQYATARLANGTVIERLPFVTRRGVDPLEFAKQEGKLATALDAARYVAICGWPAAGSRPDGSRHPQAFSVYFTDQRAQIPSGPDLLAPSNDDKGIADLWVMAGWVNAAFDAASLRRPELGRVQCLTRPQSRKHLWRVDMNLYGGVTLEDVRKKETKLQSVIGVPWMRVVEGTEDTVTFYLGATPKPRDLVNPDRDEVLLRGLDWEKAWQNAKVIGVGGALPRLIEVGALEHNQKVQVLDFELPAGIDKSVVREAVEKLKVETANLFIEVRDAQTASQVRLLTCTENPLSWPINVDFDYIDQVDDPTELPWATGVEGEPVAFVFQDNPHALVAGTSGAGKTASAQTLVYGALVKGWHLYVIDPSKLAADFAFAEDYSQYVAKDIFESAATIKTVYDEVIRRKDLNTKHGAGSYKELPEDIRPPHVAVVVDEFTSLVGTAPLPPKSDDPEMILERERLELSNLSRLEVGSYVGKIAREARSAGVTLFLCTQKLMSDSLAKIPNGGDIKDQLARVLLGKASTGQKMSTLRDFENSPKVQGEMKPGRGLWESGVATAEVVQAWFATQDTYREQLELRGVEPVTVKADVTPHLRHMPDQESSSPVFPAPPAAQPSAPVEEAVVDLGEIEFSLDDLDMDVAADLDDHSHVPDSEAADGLDWDSVVDEPNPAMSDQDAGDIAASTPNGPAGMLVSSEPLSAPDRVLSPTVADAVVFVDMDGTIAPLAEPPVAWQDWRTVDAGPFGSTAVSTNMLERLVGLGVRLVWLTDWGAAAGELTDALGFKFDAVALPSSGGDADEGEYGWWKIDAIAAWLGAHPDVKRVAWLDDLLGDTNTVTDDGEITHRERTADMLGMLMVDQTLLLDPDIALTPADLDRLTAWLSGDCSKEPAESFVAVVDVEADEGMFDDDGRDDADVVDSVDETLLQSSTSGVVEEDDDRFDDEFPSLPPLNPIDDEFA